MKENRVEIRHYNRNGEEINISSEAFRVYVQKITEEVIKRLLNMP